MDGEAYICENEKELVKEFRKEGLSPEIQIKESIQIDPDIIQIVAENTLWMINGYVFSKILDRAPHLFKKK